MSGSTEFTEVLSKGPVLPIRYAQGAAQSLSKEPVLPIRYAQGAAQSLSKET